MLELFMCLRLDLLELFLKFYSLGITKKIQIFDPNFLPKKHVGCGEGGLIQLFKQKISPN
jgi:hypothetical protein